MREIPVSVLASWPTPNLVDPPTRGSALLVFSCLFKALLLIVVPSRVYTRVKIVHNFGCDDVMILGASACSVAATVVTLIANYHYGWNRHIWDLEPWQIVPGLKISMVVAVLFGVNSWLVKLSLLVFYRKILSRPDFTIFNWAIYISMFVVTGLGWAFIFQMIFMCKPIAAFWDFGPPTYQPTYKYTCVAGGEARTLFASSVLNTFDDFVVFLLPIPIVWNLQLPVRQRLAVISLFALGLITCLAGVFKSYYIYESFYKTYDSVWVGWPVWIVSVMEMDLGVLCASIPTLRPLVMKWFPKLFQHSGKSAGLISHIARSWRLSEKTKSKSTYQGMNISVNSTMNGFEERSNIAQETELSRVPTNRYDRELPVPNGYGAHNTRDKELYDLEEVESSKDEEEGGASIGRGSDEVILEKSKQQGC